MPVAWFIVPYKRHPVIPRNRYPAIDDYTQQIHDNGGWWAETEILGNRALVKVRAPLFVLQALDNIDSFKRIPKDRLDDSLSDLSNNAKRELRNELLDQGYPLAEIRERFGNNLGDYTLRDVLRFMARRRLKPRWVPETDEILVDGEVQTPRSIESVDNEVTE